MATPQIDVLIIGGGFSGTMLAVQLLRRTSALSIAILDPNSTPGRGLAYRSPHRFHLLNVPAGEMGAFPGDPKDFLHWARNNYHVSVQARSFLPRAVYGDYVASIFHGTLAEHGSERFQWIQDEVLSVQRRKGRVAVQRQDGSEMQARAVILATGNFPPSAPKIPRLLGSGSLSRAFGNSGNSFRGAARSSVYVQFAWSDKALESLAEDASVLLLGSGLTSVDMIMGLKSKGFRGTIHVLSREGLVPSRHQPSKAWPAFWDEQAPRTTRGLLHMIREQVDAAAEQGVDWRGVVDTLRPVTQGIWQSLPVNEQRRFLRHVRPYWDVHRHRLAPEISDIFSDMEAEGQIRFHTGRITDYREENGRADITYRERGAETIKHLHAHRVINCTGSETDCRRIDDSLITSLFVQGLARPDALFLGLDVDPEGALIDYRGKPSRSLFTIGPTRKGRLWETTAVPEIRQQAEQLAGHLVDVLEGRAQDESQLFDKAV